MRLSHGKTREVSAPSFPSANEHHDASTVRITPVKVCFFFSGRNRSGNRFGWLSAVNQHLLLSSFKRFQMYRFVDVYVCVCVLIQRLVQDQVILGSLQSRGTSFQHLYNINDLSTTQYQNRNPPSWEVQVACETTRSLNAVGITQLKK